MEGIDMEKLGIISGDMGLIIVKIIITTILFNIGGSLGFAMYLIIEGENKKDRERGIKWIVFCMCNMIVLMFVPFFISIIFLVK